MNEWMRLAACRGVDPELFFPESEARSVQARQVCRSCSVRVDCLRLAVSEGIPFGVFGGLTAKRRAAVARGWS